MASQQAMTIRRANAFDRLRAAGAELAESCGVEPPDLRPHKDPEMGRIVMVENIAAFLESLVEVAAREVKKAEPPRAVRRH